MLGTGYNPPVVNVPAWNGTGNRHAIQNAVDSAAAGSLLVLSPGTYYENVVMWKPVKLQGLGVGGTFGAENLQATTPGDPRFSIPGSVIDGRFFGTNQADWNATVAAHANSGSPKYQGATTLADVMGGADVLVLAKTTGAYAIPNGATGVFSAARVDGARLRPAAATRVPAASNSSRALTTPRSPTRCSRATAVATPEASESAGRTPTATTSTCASSTTG